MPAKLIITADDYGMCAPVNQAIEECLAAGTLRATCVMTNMPLWREAGTLRARFPDASIGLHWTLTQGAPVLAPERVPALVDARGTLLPFGELRRRMLRRSVPLEQVRDELTAQYRRFREVAGQPDFWNTHEGIHVFPALFQLCVELGRTLGIRAMRSHRRLAIFEGVTPLAFYLRHPAYLLKSRIVQRWSAWAERHGTRMPDGNVVILGSAEDKASVEQVVRRVDWSRVHSAAEYTIHPATRNEPELFGAMTESRVREYLAFRDPTLKDRLQQLRIQPVGFEVL
jgi:predicted glycoside hydrolase/deacetylase ChbG (UPF0249 family)